MRIAIVGAGISGNVAARLLSQEHDVEVFEAEQFVGGHARTVALQAFGNTWRVDTGFIVFNEQTYPNFSRLLRLLDVTCQPSDMSFGVRCDRSGLEYQGSSLNGLFAQRLNLFRPRFVRMLADISRFNRIADAFISKGDAQELLRVYLARTGFKGWFVEKYLAPMASAIWSCPPGKLLDFPTEFLLRFFRNHGLLQITGRPMWQCVVGGAGSYVEKLTAPFRNQIRTGCAITRIQRHVDHVVVEPAGGAPEIFDAVVLACHADQALQLLADACDDEKAALAAIPYQRNQAVLHTDTSILPHRRRAWASWNYRIPKDVAAPVAVTYDLSRLQRLATPSPLLLTLNSDDCIAPGQVLDRFVFHHPVFTSASVAAQSSLKQLNGNRRTYFCGAYMGNGFHEDGVNSGLEVAKRFFLGLDKWKAASTKATSAMSGMNR